MRLAPGGSLAYEDIHAKIFISRRLDLGRSCAVRTVGLCIDISCRVRSQSSTVEERTAETRVGPALAYVIVPSRLSAQRSAMTCMTSSLHDFQLV